MATTTFVDGVTPLVASWFNDADKATYLNKDYADATGSANTYAVALPVTKTAYYDGMVVEFSTTAANTGASTLNVNGLGAISILNPGGVALVAGQIPANTIIRCVYNTTGPRFELQSSGFSSIMQENLRSVSASVAANALTVGLNPCLLDFRSATLTVGVPNVRAVPAALSLVVPSGATLGTTNAVAARLILLAIDNAGTIELAIVNQAGGVKLDESGLVSTTTISAGATSASTIYSTTGRTNVPYRVVGFVDITETTAGTWATAPTVVQGNGGNAMASGDFSALFNGTAGYQKLPSGLIIQWGQTTITTANTNQNVTLPIAFPSAFIGAIAGHWWDTTAPSAIATTSAGRSGLNTLVLRGSISAALTFWIAIGW